MGPHIPKRYKKLVICSIHPNVIKWIDHSTKVSKTQVEVLLMVFKTNAPSGAAFLRSLSNCKNTRMRVQMPSALPPYICMYGGNVPQNTSAFQPCSTWLDDIAYSWRFYVIRLLLLMFVSMQLSFSIK